MQLSYFHFRPNRLPSRHYRFSLALALQLTAGGLLTLVTLALTAALTATPTWAAPPAELAPELLDWHLYSDPNAAQTSTAPPDNSYTTTPTSQAATNIFPAQGQVCQGFYLAPDLDLPEAHLDQQLARLFADANQLNYSADDGLMLQGAVRLRKGGLQVTADQAAINANRDLAKLKGNLAVRQEGLLLRGSSGDYALNTDEFKLSQAHYVLHQQRLRGSAYQLQQDTNGLVILHDSSLTSCAPQDNSWRLVAGRLKLNRATGFGDAYNVRMEVLRLPVFYWPWLRFPIDDRRHTGLLSPTISWSQSQGLDYLQPFYWNLAPNLDATFYPRQIDKRGFMLGSEVRYLTPRHSGQVYYARLNSDKAYAHYDRWHFSAQHQADLGANLRLKVDFAQVSDDKYLRNLNSSGFSKTSDELLQQLKLTHHYQGWHTSLNFQGYQKLDPNQLEPAASYKLFDLSTGRLAAAQDYYRFPQLEVRKSLRFNEVWSSRLLIDLTQFSKRFDQELAYTRPTPTPKPNSATSYYVRNWGEPDALRLHLQPSLSAQWRWPWAFIRPEAKLKLNYYDLQPFWDESADRTKINSVDLNPNAAVPVFSLDSGLFLERDTQLWGGNWLQTLEPRAFFAYVPFVEQYAIPNIFDGAFAESSYAQLFQAERTTGLDRVGDIKKITLGLTQRLINQTNGREIASLGLAKAFYLEDRRLDASSLHPDAPDRPDNLPRDERNYKEVRRSSNLGLQASLNLTRNLRLNHTLMWDEHFSKTESSNTYFSYTGLANSQFNLGHSYTSNYLDLNFKGAKPDPKELDAWSYLHHAEEQFYASLIYNLNNHWRFFVKQGHDLKRGEKLDSISGVEYNSCCWQVQVVYRDWIDNPDTSPPYQANQQPEFEPRQRDYGFFINFVFKGLGGVGQNIPQLLEQEVQGYSDRP